MNGKITPEANSSNMKNANKGTTGTNKQYDQNQGNRGKQLAGTKSAAQPVKATGKQ